MNYKIIFWDNDGTLVNTEVPFFIATQKVLANEKIEFTEEWNSRECLGKGRSAFDLARAAGINEEKIHEMRAERNDLYFHELKQSVEVIEGVVDTLEELYGKIPMGIVTTSPRQHFNQIMKATGLRKYFDFFICNEDVEHVKPHPEPYLKAWKENGYAKEECLVIEDTERGVTAAKAAGLSCLLYSPNPEEHTQSQADKVIRNSREILDFIR